MFRWAAILIISFALESCVMVVSYTYFRNYSDQPVDILYAAPKTLYGPRPTRVKYHAGLLPMKKSTWKQLKDSLPIAYDGLQARLTVPAHSTVLLDRWTIIDSSVVLKQPGRIDSIGRSALSESGSRLHNKPSGFPVNWIYYYDFK